MKEQNKDVFQTKFWNELKAASFSDDNNEVVKEWELQNAYTNMQYQGGNSMKSVFCICGTEIKYVTVIYNTKTNKTLNIGSECIKKILSLCSDDESKKKWERIYDESKIKEEHDKDRDNILSVYQKQINALKKANEKLTNKLEKANTNTEKEQNKYSDVYQEKLRLKQENVDLIAKINSLRDEIRRKNMFNKSWLKDENVMLNNKVKELQGLLNEAIEENKQLKQEIKNKDFSISKGYKLEEVNTGDKEFDDLFNCNTIKLNKLKQNWFVEKKQIEELSRMLG